MSKTVRWGGPRSSRLFVWAMHQLWGPLLFTRKMTLREAWTGNVGSDLLD